MKSRHLVITLSLTLAGGAAAAALSRGTVEPASQASQPCMEQVSEDAIPRVVVTATREIPRVVVIGHQPAATLAAHRP
jgi:hypothetical protein